MAEAFSRSINYVQMYDRTFGHNFTYRILNAEKGVRGFLMTNT